jgi:hypothetical protein
MRAPQADASPPAHDREKAPQQVVCRAWARIRMFRTRPVGRCGHHDRHLSERLAGEGGTPGQEAFQPKPDSMRRRLELVRMVSA